MIKKNLKIRLINGVFFGGLTAEILKSKGFSGKN